MGRAVFRLDEDCYIEWSSVVDAPVSQVMDRASAVAAFGDERVLRADERGHSYLDMGPRSPADLVVVNRAGWREACLTLAAMIERYRPGAPSFEEVPLRPEEVQPHLTQVHAPGHEDHGKVFWTPWPPGEAPAVIDESTDLHALVLAADEDIAGDLVGDDVADGGPAGGGTA